MIIGWACGKLADSVLKGLVAHKALTRAIDKAVAEWAKSSEKYADPDALFAEVDLSTAKEQRPEYCALQAKLVQNELPGKEMWHTVFMESWRWVKDNIKEPQPFFQLDESEASRELERLAEATYDVCVQHEAIFKATVIRKLNGIEDKIDEMSEQVQEHEAEGKSVFQGFNEFFERFLNGGKLFNHTHKLVGRESELDRLKTFVLDEDQRIAVIKGAGGVGKSKLIYEFFNRCGEETPEWDVRFLSAQTEFTLESPGELPEGRVCVIVEDAHRRGRENLGSVVDAFERSRYRERTKLILSTRPSGKDMIRHVLASHDPSEILWLPVERLDPKTHAIGLAKGVLGSEYDKYAEGLVRASDGNCLIICVGGMLIGTGRLEGALVEDENFRDMVLEKYLEETEAGVSGASQAEVRRLLATLAGIGPVNVEAKEFQKMLEEDVGTGWPELAGVFDELEARELVLRRGRKLRAFPDVVADYVLLKASFDNHKKATGFVYDLAEKYGKLYFANILRNVAEVEYSIGLKGKESSLLSDIWKEIWDFIRQGSYMEIAQLLDRLEPAAIFKPKEVFDICKWALEPSNLANVRKDEVWDKHINEETVLQKIPGLLEKVGQHAAHTAEVCEELWDLANGRMGEVNPNPFPEHPFRVFARLTRLDNHNWFSVVGGGLDAVERIIEGGRHRKTRYKIQEILGGTLSQVIECNRLEGRTFTISFIRTLSCEPKTAIRKVRDRAISLLELLAKDDEPEVVMRTVDSLIKMLGIQHRGPSHEVAEEEKRELIKEGEKALELIEKACEGREDVTVRNLIVSKLGSSERHVMDEIKPKVNDVVAKFKEDDLRYRVQYCMLHDWAEFVRDEEYEVTKKAFGKRQEATAKELWGACNGNAKKLIAFLSEIVQKCTEVDIGCEGRTFQYVCANANAEGAGDVIRELLGIDDTYLAFSVGYWFPSVIQEAKYEIALEVMKKGKTQHKRGLASCARSFEDMDKTQAVEISRMLANEQDRSLRLTVGGNLGTIYKNCGEPDEIKEMICEFDTGDDRQVLDSLLGSVDKRFGIDPEKLSKEQQERLVAKIGSVRVLGRDDYHISEFIKYVRGRDPKALVELFLNRVKRSGKEEDGGKEDKFQPFPYTGLSESGLSDISGHSDFADCVGMVVEASRDGAWEYHFWCPRVFKWLDHNFCEKTRAILSERLEEADEREVVAIGSLLEDYEREIVFLHVEFIGTLLERARSLGGECYGKVQSRLSSAVFSGVHGVSPPGEPDAHHLGIANCCKTVLKKKELPKAAIDFYKLIQQRAEAESQRKLKEDSLEQAEEEI